MAEAVGTDRLAGTGGAAPTAPTKRHVFEHLGPAPYKFLSMETRIYKAAPEAPAQPGSSCDHCGTAIVYVFWLKAADGKVFKVGSICIGKSGDAGLRRVVSDVERKARAAKAVDRRVRIEAALADPETRAKLAAKPHPMGWSGKTLLDWATWMHAHAGNAGHERIERALKEALA